VSFNLIPAAVMPIIEGATNYSFFRQAPIEGVREQDMRPADRITGASSAAILMGQNLGISDTTGFSPVMLQHYLEGWGGSYWVLAQAAVDIALGDSELTAAPVGGAFGDGRVSRALQSSFGSMLKRRDQSPTRFVEQFYEDRDHITQIYRSAQAAADQMRVDYARALLESASGTPAAYRLVNKAGYELGRINNQIRGIRQDRTMSPAQKRDAIEPLLRARNRLVRRVSGMVDEIEEKQGATFKEVAR